MASRTFAEDDLGRRWDRCITDGLIKISAGTLIGTLASVFFFKRRRWPILVGAGFGFGMAYKNCENEVNESITTGCQRK